MTPESHEILTRSSLDKEWRSESHASSANRIDGSNETPKNALALIDFFCGGLGPLYVNLQRGKDVSSKVGT
jgi:hypothetical protein